MLICLACFEDRMASLCENAESFCLYRIEDGKPVADRELRLNGGSPVSLASGLASEGVGELVCGGITGCSRRSLAEAGVNVTSWIRGTRDEVLKAWEEGKLDSLSMPGCGGPGCGRGMNRGQGLGQGKGPGMGQGQNQGRGMGLGQGQAGGQGQGRGKGLGMNQQGQGQGRGMGRRLRARLEENQ